MIRKYSRTSIATICLLVLVMLAALSVYVDKPARASQHISLAKIFRPAAPGYQQTTYPINADNGTDIFESTGPTTIVTAPIIAPAASTTKIISGVTGKQILILGISYSATGAAGTIQLQDEAGSPNKLTGVYGCLQNTTTNLSFTKGGYVTTLSGASVDVVTVGASAVFGGTVTYCYF
jgi:hypothetical protein